MNISVDNILGFAIGLAIFYGLIRLKDYVEDKRDAKEHREFLARFEADKEKYLPDQSCLDALLRAATDSRKPKGKISYETFFSDIEAMGFKEEPISMFETAATFEDGAYKYLKKYKARELFPDCLVVLYTNFHQPIPRYPKIHSASSSIRIDYIDNSAPFWARLFTEHIFANLESFNGSLKDLIIKLHGRYVEHCEGLNLNNNNTKEKK